MGLFLQSLRDGGPIHAVEKADRGFAIVRKPKADPDAFNLLARETIDRAGADFVALPSTDGRGGYDQVVIIPLD